MPASFEHIATQSAFESFLADIGKYPWIAIDTEFVAEDTFRPELCLVQVAVPERLLVIDPFPIRGINHFWEAVVNFPGILIVHGGRKELEFARHTTGRLPQQVFDTQVAAGLIGLEYPIGYSNLVEKLLGKTVEKSARQTDWRRRPLSSRQLDYALEDVRHLPDLFSRLREQLHHLGRWEWFQEEMEEQKQLVIQLAEEHRWWRVSGSGSLDAQAQAILRELWLWRQKTAEELNRPPRRVLRDDLLVEIARQKTADLDRLMAIRGMKHRQYRKYLPAILETVQRALRLPPNRWPRLPASAGGGVAIPPVLTQFLYAAMNNLCKNAQVAVGLVGGPSEIRHWLAWRFQGEENEPPPLLARGWRKQLVTDLMEELVAGKKAVWVADPTAEVPLAFGSCDKTTQADQEETQAQA